MKLLIALPGAAAAHASNDARVIALYALGLFLFAFFGSTGCFDNLRGGSADRDEVVPHTGSNAS